MIQIYWKPSELKLKEPPEDINPVAAAMNASGTGVQKGGENFFMDAMKPKQMRKKRASSTADAS